MSPRSLLVQWVIEDVEHRQFTFETNVDKRSPYTVRLELRVVDRRTNMQYVVLRSPDIRVTVVSYIRVEHEMFLSMCSELGLRE